MFGLKRKKKTREKMRDIKTKAEKDQEKSKESLLEEKPVERLNPLFLVHSSPSTPVADERKISNPLLSVGYFELLLSFAFFLDAVCF